MALTTRSYGKVNVVELSGRFDAHMAPAVQDQLRRVASPWIVINLSGVYFVDSGALAVLISAMKHCRQQGGDLRLCDLQQPVQIIFEMTKMNRAFDLCASEAEAVGTFHH